jgi:hypothetical protein
MYNIQLSTRTIILIIIVIGHILKMSSPVARIEEADDVPQHSHISEQSNKHRQYTPHTHFGVCVTYIILLLVWIVCIIWFKLYNSPAWYVLVIPFLAFINAIVTSRDLTYDMEDEMFKASYLSIGLILALPLLAWMNKDFGGDKDHFATVIFLALGFTILTYIDVWVTRRWLSVFKHIRSGLQTMAVTLFLFAIVTYYMKRPGGSLP